MYNLTFENIETLSVDKELKTIIHGKKIHIYITKNCVELYIYVGSLCQCADVFSSISEVENKITNNLKIK